MKSLFLVLAMAIPLQGFAADKFIIYGVTRVADQRSGNIVVAGRAYAYDESGVGNNPIPARVSRVIILQENGHEKTNCSERGSAAFARGGNLEIFVDENNWWAEHKQLFNKNVEIEIPARAVAICATQAP